MREIWNLQWLAHFLWTQTDELATVAGGNTRLHFIISPVGGVTSAGERTSAWCTYCTLQVMHATPSPSSSERSGEIHVCRLANLTWPHEGGTSCFASMKNDVTCTKCVCVCLLFPFTATRETRFFFPRGNRVMAFDMKLELTFALAFDAILWNVPSRL